MNLEQLHERDEQFTISEELLHYIYSILPTNKTILELGSGLSTHKFIKHGYKVLTIEDDIAFINLVPGAVYIHAPIKQWNNTLPRSISKRCYNQIGWYDTESIVLPSNYDLILVDGPKREIGRVGFYINLGMFLTDIPILFDDIHSPNEYFMARMCAQKLKRDLVIKNNCYNKRPFGVILP